MKWPLNPVNPDLRARLGVASRVLAASIGGYALICALAVWMALLLPTGRAQAVMLASDLGFLIYLPVLLWVFHTRSATRAWGWLLGWTAIFSLLSWWWMPGSAA